MYRKNQVYRNVNLFRLPFLFWSTYCRHIWETFVRLDDEWHTLKHLKKSTTLFVSSSFNWKCQLRKLNSFCLWCIQSSPVLMYSIARANVKLRVLNMRLVEFGHLHMVHRSERCCANLYRSTSGPSIHTNLTRKILCWKILNLNLITNLAKKMLFFLGKNVGLVFV